MRKKFSTVVSVQISIHSSKKEIKKRVTDLWTNAYSLTHRAKREIEARCEENNYLQEGKITS